MVLTYAYLLNMSRDNTLMSGVRQKERFSSGTLCPSGIIKGIPRGKFEGGGAPVKSAPEKQKTKKGFTPVEHPERYPVQQGERGKRRTKFWAQKGALKNKISGTPRERFSPIACHLWWNSRFRWQYLKFTESGCAHSNFFLMFYASLQSASNSPCTRSNSLTLFVTSIRPMALA